MSVSQLSADSDALMVADAIDLPAYLERIGYHGPLVPTPELLATLVERHMAAIPFEAIDVLLDRGVDLAPSAVDTKMLAGQRGGYCFEHASLLRRALLAIGFPVESHLARVWVHGGLEAPVPAATHASLKVSAGERLWLVDVGFGGFMANQPLVWQPDTPQQTRFGAFRITETAHGFMVESQHRGRWSPLYEILDFDWQPVDFEMANHYVAEHPASHFRHELMVARTQGDSRSTLAGNRLKIASVDGACDERRLDADGLADALATVFGLPVAADWRPLLERVAAGTD
ncbi:arylamine N-acetyltransferase family protein [Salinisphaera aquimarina]|uniref:Arylamine N-acetyltransferase n=1 Tax=Salinisphaera aquimarina TaxID=2094031 RepID=A0ABV7EJ18_9GAMM